MHGSPSRRLASRYTSAVMARTANGETMLRRVRPRSSNSLPRQASRRTNPTSGRAANVPGAISACPRPMPTGMEPAGAAANSSSSSLPWQRGKLGCSPHDRSPSCESMLSNSRSSHPCGPAFGRRGVASAEPGHDQSRADADMQHIVGHLPAEPSLREPASPARHRLVQVDGAEADVERLRWSAARRCGTRDADAAEDDVEDVVRGCAAGESLSLRYDEPQDASDHENWAEDPQGRATRIAPGSRPGLRFVHGCHSTPNPSADLQR